MYPERFVCGRGPNGKYVCWAPCRIEADTQEAVFQRWQPIVATIDEVLGREATFAELRAGGIAHEDHRSERERHADRYTREADLAERPNAKSATQQLVEHLEQTVEREQISKLPLREQHLHKARKELAAEQAAESAAAADAAARAQPALAKALSDAQLTALAASFDPSLSAAEVEAAQHRLALLERSYDEKAYWHARNEWAKTIAARSAESEAEALAIYEQRRAAAKRYLPPEPPAGTTTEPSKPVIEKIEHAGQDKFKRALVRVFFDGGSAVITKSSYEAFVSDDDGLRSWAADESNHVEPVETRQS